MSLSQGFDGTRRAAQRPQIVVVGNEKGGTGKSTTTLHLAVAALSRGYRTGVLDLDTRQASVTRYLNNRERYSNTVVPVPLPRRSLVKEPQGYDPTTIETAARRAIEAALAELGDCEVVIVDTPGSATALARIGHEVADKLVTPLNDSLLDIDVLAEIDPIERKIVAPCHYCRMAWEHGNQRIADGLPAIDWIVIRNRQPHVHSRNRADVEQILEKLSQRIGFRLAPGLSERVIFRELFLNGLTVLDLAAATRVQDLAASHRSAIEEIETLFDALGLAAPTRATADQPAGVSAEAADNRS